MVYGFVRQSGGRVWLRSAPEEGTTINLLLPRSVATLPAPVAQTMVVGEPLDVNGIRVLVVDDEPVVRAVIVEVVRELQYTGMEAETAAEALSLLRSGGRIDILVTDVGLPGSMNGRQLADAARELDPALPILFVTGYAEEGVFERSGLPHGMQIVSKPFQLDDFARQLTSLAAARIRSINRQ